MEADPDRRAAQGREDGAHAGEQLEVQHRVEPERAHASDGADGVVASATSDPILDRNDSLGRHEVQQVECGEVLIGTKHVEGG